MKLRTIGWVAGALAVAGLVVAVLLVSVTRVDAYPGAYLHNASRDSIYVQIGGAWPDLSFTLGPRQASAWWQLTPEHTRMEIARPGRQVLRFDLSALGFSLGTDHQFVLWGDTLRVVPDQRWTDRLIDDRAALDAQQQWVIAPSP